MTGLTMTKSVALLLHLSYFKADELLEKNKRYEVIVADTWGSKRSHNKENAILGASAVDNSHVHIVSVTARRCMT